MPPGFPIIAPGVYLGSNLAQLLYENQQAYLFNNQAIVSGQASIAVQLRRERGASYPFGVSFQIQFSGAPGTYEVDVQTADLDQDAAFVTVASLSSANALNASNQGRIELTNVWAKFVRVKVVQLTNAVNMTALVTR